jgi:acyl-CoA dehydrogenase
VLRHKLLPFDPLDVQTSSDENSVIDALVNARSVTLDQALQVLPAGSV